MLTRPSGQRRRKAATAAACALSTLCATTQGSVSESPTEQRLRSEHLPAVLVGLTPCLARVPATAGVLGSVDPRIAVSTRV